MNKKIGIFMVFVLLVGAVFLSACQQEAVGRKVSFREEGGNDGDREEQRGEMVDTREIESDYDTMFESSGNSVALFTKNIDSYSINEDIFYYDTNLESIKLGGDNDERLIVREGDILSVDDVNGFDIEDLTGTMFLHDKNGRSRIVEIIQINPIYNKTSFRVRDTNTEYEDQNYIEGEAIIFDNILANTFTLTINKQDGTITFNDINDEDDGISKIRTYEYEAITLSEENPMIVIEDGQWRAGMDGEGRIEINLNYDESDQEIDIAGVIMEEISTRFKDLGIRFNRIRDIGSDEIKLKYMPL